MGVVGPMARTVPDLAMLLSIQAGYDPRLPLSIREDPATVNGVAEVPGFVGTDHVSHHVNPGGGDLAGEIRPVVAIMALGARRLGGIAFSPDGGRTILMVLPMRPSLQSPGTRSEFCSSPTAISGS
jgi:hypothetical protein